MNVNKSFSNKIYFHLNEEEKRIVLGENNLLGIDNKMFLSNVNDFKDDSIDCMRNFTLQEQEYHEEKKLESMGIPVYSQEDFDDDVDGYRAYLTKMKSNYEAHNENF